MYNFHLHSLTARPIATPPQRHFTHHRVHALDRVVGAYSTLPADQMSSNNSRVGCFVDYARVPLLQRPRLSCALLDSARFCDLVSDIPTVVILYKTLARTYANLTSYHWYSRIPTRCSLPVLSFQIEGFSRGALSVE